MLATVAVLGIGLIASTLFWYRSEQQRHDATMQAARAEAVVRFLSDDLIGALSPGGAGFERDPTVREMLEHAAGPLAERFGDDPATRRSEEHTSELQSLMRNSYAVFCLKQK